jgi:hypothetical protein
VGEAHWPFLTNTQGAFQVIKNRRRTALRLGFGRGGHRTMGFGTGGRSAMFERHRLSIFLGRLD